MLNIVFQRSSTPITDTELLSVMDAIRPVIAGGDSEDKDLALLLARMVFRIEALRDTPPLQEPLAWESITPVYIRFITDSRYRKFSPEVRKWYRPICRKCAACPPPTLPAGHQLVPIEPTTALLVPFIGCPTDELPIAWAAMLRIAAAQSRRQNETHKGTPQ